MSSMKRAFHASGRSRTASRAGEELLLELEAEDDVQPVARLVRVDADEPAPRAVDRAMEALERHIAEGGRECGPGREGSTTARTGASDRRRSPTVGSETRGDADEAQPWSGVRSREGAEPRS